MPGLIAYWPFDSASEIESDLVVVDLVAGMQGVVNGSGVTAVDGQFGSALDFGTEASDTSVTIEYVNDWLQGASDDDQLSVSVWQKLHEVRSTSTLWFSAASAPGGQRNYQAHIPCGNSNIYFDTAGCCGGGDTRISAAGGIDFLEWHHFVFVKDGENKTIYIDGELFLEGVNTGTLYDDWGTTYLGVNDLGNGGHMAGIIDDFGVWDRALTEDEVGTIWNGGSGSPLYTEAAKFLIGLNFGADQGGGSLEADVSAGVTGSVQGNWNNLAGEAGSASLVDQDGADTGATVEWTSNNTWSSTGGGEENNGFEDGGDKTLFTGYLDTT